jgi:hypothetical protein
MFVALIFLVVTGFAGHVEALNFSFGVKAGTGISNFNGEDAISSLDWKFSYSGGGFIEIMLIDIIRIQPEVLFFSKGTNWDLLGDTIVYNFYYIDMPVLVKFYPLLTPPVKLNIFIGPYVGVKLYTKAEGAGVSTTDLGVNRIEPGFLYGIGFDIWKLTVDVRTSFSLASITEDSDEDLKNNVLSLMVGYRIR